MAETLEQAMDKARIGKSHWLAFVLCGAVMFLDGYDLADMPLAVPHLVAGWHIAPAAFSIALSAVVAGLGAGAVLFAPLGDRFGRRPTMIITALLIAVSCFGTALASSVTGFEVWRLLTGLALGACLPNASALVAELAPKRRRASMLTIVSCSVAIGAIAAAMVVPPLVALGGWRAIFIASGIATLLITVALWAALPESPKFLLLRGHHARLFELAGRLGFSLEAVSLEAIPVAKRSRQSILAPLGADHRVATAVFVGIYTINALSIYMLISWAPTILPQAGFPVDTAARLSSLLQSGGLVGGLLLSWFLDRGKTVVALLTAYGLVAASLAAFSIVPLQIVAWSVLLLIVGAGVGGAHMAIMAVGTMLYPAEMLSSALGLVVAVGRIGAIAGPLIGGWLIAHGYSAAAFFLVLIVPVAVCCVGVLFIPMAQRRRAAGEMSPQAVTGAAHGG